MRLKVEEVGIGLHPSEVFVKVTTVEGPQELVVNKRSLHQSTIDVGEPISRQDDNFFLVELPAETSNGAWRIWVDKSVIVNGALEAAE